MKPNEYIKKCPYCEKEFEAKHLSRSYCSEKCKRRMYRSKKQKIRMAAVKEKDQYLNNNKVLTKLYRPDLQPFGQMELIKAGFNSSFMKDRLKYADKMLVTFENHFLELLSGDKIIIHKKF